MPNYAALIAKWATLASPTIAGKLTEINAATVAGPPQPMIIPTYAIYNAIVPADFQSLTAVQQQFVRDILSMGQVDVSPGTNARAVLLQVFTGKTNTLNAFAALAQKYDSPPVLWYMANGYTEICLGDVIAAEIITAAEAASG